MPDYCTKFEAVIFQPKPKAHKPHTAISCLDTPSQPRCSALQGDLLLLKQATHCFRRRKGGWKKPYSVQMSS